MKIFLPLILFASSLAAQQIPGNVTAVPGGTGNAVATDTDVAAATAALRILAGSTSFHYDYYASLVGTPACTIGGTTYTTGTDCMNAAADAANAAAPGGKGEATVLYFDSCGTYPINYPIIQYYNGLYNGTSKSVVAPASGCVTLQATTHMTAMLYHPNAAQAVSQSVVRGLYLDANFLADSCMFWHSMAGQSMVQDVTCANTDFIDDNGNSNVPMDFGDTNGGNSDFFVDNVVAGGSNHGSQGAGNPPHIEAVVTAGAISGYYVYYQATGYTITAAGTGGTAGTYNWTSTGTCRVQPSGTYTISGGGITAVTIGSTPTGYGIACPSSTSPTIVLATGTGLSGGSFTLTMTTGETKIGVPFSGQPAIPIVPVLISHALGQYGCTVPPAVYQNSTPGATTTTAGGTVSTYNLKLAGELVTGIPFTYNGDGSLVGGAVPLADSSLASTGSGCSAAKPIDVWLAVGSPVYQGMTFSFPDGHVRFARSTVGLDVCFAQDGGGTDFFHLHAYDGCHNSIGQYGGNATYTNTEIDSPHGFGFKITNGSSIFRDTTLTWDSKDAYTGAAGFGLLQGGSTYQKISGMEQGIPPDIANYDTYVGIAGPVSTGVGAFESGLYDILLNSTQTPFSGMNTGEIVVQPIQAPTTGIQYRAAIPSNSTTTSRSLALYFCGNKYVNTSTTSGCYNWGISVTPGSTTNQLIFSAPTNDPGLISNSTPPAVGFSWTPTPTYQVNWGSPVFFWKGAGCALVTSTTCTTPTFPQLNFQLQLNPQTGGTLTSFYAAYTHTTSTLPYTFQFPGGSQWAGVTTPGVTYSPITTPSGLYTHAFTTGGTLAAATYYYCATSLSTYGETTCGTPIAVPTTGTTSEVNVALTTIIPNAIGHNIYRCTSTTTSTCGLITPYSAPSIAGLSQGIPGMYDTGSVAPGAAPPAYDQSMAPVSYQVGTPFIAPTGSTTALGGAGQTIVTTGAVNAQYVLRGAINCDVIAASTSVTLTVNYTDPSGSTIPITATANCAALGATADASFVQTVRIKAGTSVKAFTTLTTGSPNYEASTTAMQDTQH